MRILLVNNIREKLIINDALFKNIFVVNQEFDILPNDKKHYGAAIDYLDIKELRSEFVNELIDSIVDWVYSSEKYEELKDIAKRKGKSERAANSEVIMKARNKFRKSEDPNELLIQGQLGELLLFHFIQRFMEAVPLLRKMKITTSTKHERFGADAIHYKKENDRDIFILGEAKTYTSDYKFNRAFEDALESIINTYNKHLEELGLYVHEDFLDQDLDEIAELYLSNSLENPEVHLVSIVVYNEKKEINLTSKNEIHQQIIDIIEEKYKNFDKAKLDLKNNAILKRITYIVFPIWDLKDLALDFQNRI